MLFNGVRKPDRKQLRPTWTGGLLGPRTGLLLASVCLDHHPRANFSSVNWLRAPWNHARLLSGTQAVFLAQECGSVGGAAEDSQGDP